MGAFIKGRGEYRYIVWKNDIYILHSDISEKQFGACIVENYPEEYMNELRNTESLPAQLEKMHHEDYACDCCIQDIKTQSTSEDECESNECLFPYLPNKDGNITKKEVHICGCCGAAFVYKDIPKQLDEGEVHVCDFCHSGHIDEENPECTLNGTLCDCKPNFICKQCVAQLFPKDEVKNTEFLSDSEEEIITSLDDRMI